MGPLYLASWPEYQGSARVRYDLIQFDPTKEKHFLASDARRWGQIWKNLSSPSDELAYAPIVAVSATALQEARRTGQGPRDSQTIPALSFQAGEMMCLDGQSRIKAALDLGWAPGRQRFGVVHLVLDSEAGPRPTSLVDRG